MDLEVSYTFETEQQFWDELDDVLLVNSPEHELIDNALRNYLHLVANHQGEFITSEHDIARCAFHLLHSALFQCNPEYVRRQIIYGLLQEDSPATLVCISAVILHDGRQNEIAFEMMNEEGAFLRLHELIMQERIEDGLHLHRMLLELLYEMCRIQKIRIEDLLSVDDAFVAHLFEVVETLADDVHDPYHYPIIRVVLVLNEQYMVCAHDPSSTQGSEPKSVLTNKVLKVLARNGAAYKSFGQNLILLLNRESETSLQLLILKLLYLLFTSPPTYEYFYTNDLHVLLDIVLRNLLDLPQSAAALRHTYLRVLYPFLSYSQLKHPPHYKQEEIQRLLAILDSNSMGHFGETDETTQRLVARCKKVPWLTNRTDEYLSSSSIKIDDKTHVANTTSVVKFPQALQSTLSVAEIAVERSEPGVITPSKKNTPSGVKLEPAAHPKA